MSFTKKELSILIAGLCGLLFLGVINFSKMYNTPPEPAPLPESIVPEDFSKNRIFRLDGMVFSTDRNRKTVCARDEKTGNLLWESKGEDRFIIPGAAFPLDLSPDGELWVANVGKKRLEQLNPRTGEFIASWQPRVPFAGCCNPVRFAVLSKGRFITIEKGTKRICIYQPSGEMERVVSDSLSSSEDNYYLYHKDKVVYIFDAGTSRKWEIPYD
jgi:outer membrane protein assembly factor BamB